MVNQALLDYVRRALEQKIDLATIKTVLSGAGWQEADIEEAFWQTLNQPETTAETVEPDQPEEQPAAIQPEEQPVVAQPETQPAEAAAPQTEDNQTEETPVVQPVQEEVKKKRRGKGFLLVFLLLVLAAAGGMWWFKQNGGINLNEKEKVPVTEEEPVPTAEPTLTPMPTIEPAPTIAPITLENYTHASLGFKINSPAGWTKDESGQLGTVVIFMNTQAETQGENAFNASINVTSSDLTGSTLEEVLAASKAQLPVVFQNHQLTTEKEVMINDQKAYLIGSKFTQGVFDLENMQLLAAHGERVYVVTATSLATAWEKYEKTFEEALLSFTFNQI